MIGVIVNRNARRVRRDPALVERLARVAGSVRVVSTEHAGQLPHAIEDLLDRGAGLLAVCGGDGTVGAVLPHLTRPARRPAGLRLGVLPAGTMNTIARNLGIRGAPEAVLAGLAGREANGDPIATVRRATLTVNGRRGMLFGAAMAARFLEVYYARRGGLATALGLAIEISLSAIFNGSLGRRLFAPVAAQVTLDGERLAAPGWSLLLASTLEDMGLGVRVTYRAGERLDRFHAVASGLSGRRLALQFQRTFLGRPLRGPDHHDRLAGQMRIVFGQPEPYMLDGELLRARQLELAVGPVVEFCRP